MKELVAFATEHPVWTTIWLSMICGCIAAAFQRGR